MIRDFAFDVFLSHSAKDKPRVREIAEKLRAAGLRVWFDQWTIAPGEDIYLAIERGLEASRTLILFLSPAAQGSDWVGLERSATLFRDPANRERRFVPVLLEDCELPDALRRYRYIDLRSVTDSAFSELLAACAEEVQGPAAPVPSPGSKKPKRSRPGLRGSSTQRKVMLFAFLSLVSFLASLVLLWILVAKAEVLVRLGLEEKLYYLVLLPLGLAVAGFLFGVLRSSALYRGKVPSGRLELRGAFVAFCLVVFGGYWLVPNPEPFAVTVFVHGPGGIQDLPLRNNGFVVLDLGPDRRREKIGEKGQAYFPGIPASFRGEAVPVWVEADGYVPVGPVTRHELDGTSLYLAVKRDAVKLHGRVQDREGQPIAGAELHVRDLSTTAGPDGAFALEIPGQLLDEDLYLDVSAKGYMPWRELVVPDANEVVAVLWRPGQ